MKYLRFEKIKKGDNPVVRVTYKTFWGKIVTKDVFRTDHDFWHYLENDEMVYPDQAIRNFEANDDDVYFVNGPENNELTKRPFISGLTVPTKEQRDALRVPHYDVIA